MRKSSGDLSLDDLYDKMVSSPAYLDWQSKSDAFFGKVKFYGDVSTINSEAKLFAWIDENITQTQFTSFSAAQAEYALVKNAHDLVIIENIPFYEGIQKSPKPIQALIDLTEPVIGVPKDDCGCKDAFVAASTAAGEEYATNLANAIRATDFADFESIDRYKAQSKIIEDAYDLQTEKNKEDYRLCLYNCNK